MDNKVMYSLSYGLFVLSARQGDKDNGCITNTAIQVTTDPNRIVIAVNKSNYTHDMVKETGRFTVSVLSEEAKFELFKRFGFQSGRDVDKFHRPGHPHPLPGRRTGRRRPLQRPQRHLQLLSSPHQAQARRGGPQREKALGVQGLRLRL